MIYITILNTIAIVFLFYNKGNFYIEFKKETTMFNKTITGYLIILWKKTSEYSASGVYSIRIPIKNKEKAEKEEEIDRLISSSDQNKLQTLNAKFSWLKTWEQVSQFEKDYMVVDRKIVEKLVSDFIPKK